jgi:hypothetical protein
MARKDEAVDWLKKGCPPSKIAEQMGVTISSVRDSSLGMFIVWDTGCGAK